MIFRPIINGSKHFTQYFRVGQRCAQFTLQRSTSSSSSPWPVLTLFTKDHCELCDKAKASISHLSDQFILQEVDITAPGNEKWFELYRYEIPVFFLGRQFFSKNTIDPVKLEKTLKSLE